MDEADRASGDRSGLTGDRPTEGYWHLDLHTGTAWRDAAHDRAFGYDGLQGEWTLDRFMEHVCRHERDAVLTSHIGAIEGFRPWAFSCDVMGADGSDRRIEARGDFRLGRLGSPPHLAGVVRSVPTRARLEDETLSALVRLRDVDPALHAQLEPLYAATRRQSPEIAETTLRAVRLAARGALLRQPL